jgi:hypothetical protein
MARGGLGGGRKPPGKGPSQPGRGHTAVGVSIREKFNSKVSSMLSQGRIRVSLISVSSCSCSDVISQVSNLTEDELTDLNRKASSVTLTTLRQRPAQRRLVCNPFDTIDYTSREAYQVAAEGFIRGVINTIPCDSCARGVEPHTRGLPIYPECVSVPLEEDADLNDPETRWLMKGACMNCHHRSYTNCSCRECSFDSGSSHS